MNDKREHGRWKKRRSDLHRSTNEAIGFDEAEGKSDQVNIIEFDYSAVEGKASGPDEERAEFDKQAEREVFMLFGQLWAEVLEWVYVPKNSRLIGLRLKAVIYCVRPSMMGDRTLQQIADREGCRKQTFQDLTQKFRDHFKTVCRAMRTEASREKMRAAALRIHARKRAAANRA